MLQFVSVHVFVILIFTAQTAFFSWTSKEPQITKNHALGTINFYKELFTEEQKDGLRDLRAALFGGYWRYYDFEDTPKDGVSWQLPLDSELLSQSPLWKLLNEILPQKSNNEGVSAHVDSVVRLLRRGDNTKIHSQCNKQESGYTAILFLTQLPDKNSYGEVLFFQDGDVHSTIQPGQFHLLLWSCRIPYQFQYPSISTGFGQVLLQITIYDKIDIKPLYLPLDIKPFPVLKSHKSPNNLEMPYNFKAQDHLTHAWNTSLNRPIYVIDNIFSEHMLSSLREHLYLSSQYYYDDSDDEGESDNVHWISGHRTHEFVKSELWSLVNSTLNQITGHEGWYPYDVSCNLNRAWDHTRIHKDCYSKEEYTFLLYLSPDYQPGHLGGTVFYEQEDVGTIVTSIQNRYGRVALFHCDIKHAARPPHAYLTSARYTFAVKVARSKLEAVQREIMTEPSILLDYEDDEEKERVVTALTKAVGSDPDKLEDAFVDMYREATRSRLQHLEDSLKGAGQKVSNIS